MDFAIKICIKGNAKILKLITHTFNNKKPTNKYPLLHVSDT